MLTFGAGPDSSPPALQTAALLLCPSSAWHPQPRRLCPQSWICPQAPHVPSPACCTSCHRCTAVNKCLFTGKRKDVSDVLSVARWLCSSVASSFSVLDYSGLCLLCLCAATSRVQMLGCDVQRAQLLQVLFRTGLHGCRT